MASAAIARHLSQIPHFRMLNIGDPSAVLAKIEAKQESGRATIGWLIAGIISSGAVPSAIHTKMTYFRWKTP
jgi:hypothetical protein